MREVYNIFESAGILSEGHVSSIKEFSAKQTLELYERIYALIYEAQNKEVSSFEETSEVDPFRFFAGASVRGDSTCWEPLCRIQKLDFLGHYAALYASEITLPLPLRHPDNLGNLWQTRELLSLSALTLLRLRPLIAQGIVRPAVMQTAHCIHTIEFARRMTDLVHEYVIEVTKRSMPEFEVVYQIPEQAPGRLSAAYIKGPRDFLEHGEVVVTFNEKPGWRLKSWRYDKDGKIELGGKRKMRFLRHILDEIANTISFYLADGLLHRARLLTDLPGEASVLRWLTGDENLVETTSAMQYLSHSVPILSELSLATLMRMRRQERDSFESYRKAITQITSDVLREKRRLSKKQAQQMFKDCIEPQLTQLRKEVRYERRRQRKRIISGAASAAAAVAIGAFGGLPLAIRGAMAGAAALTGGRLLAKAGEVACEHGANLRQQNDLYFLLRLEQEALE
jgi:hypothetical protein